MPVYPAQLIACRECDLLHREISLPSGGEAHCRRCDAMLYRSSPGTFDNTLAFALAAAVLFVLANVYPLLGIEMKGNPNVTNLSGAAHYLWDHDMRLISTLVGITAIIIPALEIALIIYLLLPLRFRIIPAGVPLIMRVLQGIRPWGMVEVFMLGILVSIVKLRDTSTIIPGVALWSFGGLTLMLAAVASSFNPRDIWVRIEQETPREKQHE
jgi:paraquat-inducible protein A